MLSPMLYILWQKLIKVHSIVSHLIKTNHISWPELVKASETVHGTKPDFTTMLRKPVKWRGKKGKGKEKEQGQGMGQGKGKKKENKRKNEEKVRKEKIKEKKRKKKKNM